MKKTGLFLLFSLLLLLHACINRDDFKTVPESVLGYRPIYFDSTVDINTLIYSTNPRQLVNPGKIYLYKNYLFVGEPGLGVHVFDNSNPRTPAMLCFINIPYNYDVAVKDSVLFADTYMGLITINIAHLPNIKVIQHVRGPVVTPSIPGSMFNGRRDIRHYFECIDPSKGTVVAWYQDTLKKPKCYQ